MHLSGLGAKLIIMCRRLRARPHVELFIDAADIGAHGAESDAELVRVRGAGHMVMLEEPQMVNDHLVMSLQQSAYGRENGRRRWWRR